MEYDSTKFVPIEQYNALDAAYKEGSRIIALLLKLGKSDIAALADLTATLERYDMISAPHYTTATEVEHLQRLTKIVTKVTENLKISQQGVSVL
jgi:hypothetical protein